MSREIGSYFMGTYVCWFSFQCPPAALPEPLKMYCWMDGFTYCLSNHSQWQTLPGSWHTQALFNSKHKL